MSRQWSTPAAAALSHARRGWVLVPLKPGTGLPARKWAHVTSTPPGAVATWWPGPLYNPGILTGPSSLIVVDLDSLAGHGVTLPPEWAGSGVTHGAEVLGAAAQLVGETIPATYTVTTARGGTHLYFQAPDGAPIGNSRGRIGPLVDVRGVGGLVVAAGSVKAGGAYELTDDREPVRLPAWLAELASRPRPAPCRSAAADSVTVTRDITRRGYGAAALRAETAILAATCRGGRNDQLNRSAYALGQLVGSGDLAEAEVTTALLSAAQANGLIADDGLAAAERTLRSGLTAGIAQPRARRAA
jgi:Bifunctional DNA primase/polymerase, N-terminal